MQTPFLVAPPIYLRPLARSDLNATYLGWLNDPVVARYLESGTFPTTLEQLERYYDRSAAAPAEVHLAIAECEGDAHVGNVKLGPIDWVHRRATFGILVGERRCWGRGIGTRATRLMVEYAFDRLDLHRVVLGVYAEHEAAVRSYARVGFRVEGRCREDFFHEGARKDRLWMGLLRSEYRRDRPAEAARERADRRAPARAEVPA